MKLSKVQVSVIAISSVATALLAIAPAFRIDILYISQFIVMAHAVFQLRNNRTLKWATCLLAAADLMYYLEVYKLHQVTDSIITVVSTSTLYGSSFALYITALCKNRIALLKRMSISWLDFPAVLFFTSIASVYILIPGTIKLLAQGLSAADVSYLITLSTSVPLIIISYLYLVNLTSIKDHIFLIGLLTVGIIDVGVQLETINYGNLGFTFYDVLWFYALTLLAFSANENSLAEAPVSQVSIVNLIKKVFFLAAFLPVCVSGILIRLHSDVSPMYFIICTIAIFYFGLTCSAFIQLGINRYNDKLLELQSSPTLLGFEKVLEVSPIEFRNSLYLLFSSVVEKVNFPPFSGHEQTTNWEKSYGRQIEEALL